MNDELWTEEDERLVREELYLDGPIPDKLIDYYDLRRIDLRRKLYSAFHALFKIVKLSPAERGFIQDISESIAEQNSEDVNAVIFDRPKRTLTTDLIDIFADWLEDNDRPEHAERMRKVPVRDGDLIVATLHHEGEYDLAKGWLETHYPDNKHVILHYEHSDISTLRVNPGDVIVVKDNTPSYVVRYMPEPANENAVRRVAEQFANTHKAGETVTFIDESQGSWGVQEPDWLQRFRKQFPENRVVVVPGDVEVEANEER